MTVYAVCNPDKQAQAAMSKFAAGLGFLWQDVHVMHPYFREFALQNPLHEIEPKPGDVLLVAKLDLVDEWLSMAVARVADWAERGIRVYSLDSGGSPLAEHLTVLRAAAALDRGGEERAKAAEKRAKRAEEAAEEKVKRTVEAMAKELLNRQELMAAMLSGLGGTASNGHSAEFGQAVKARRLELGLSQEALAEKIGASPAAISRLEASGRGSYTEAASAVLWPTDGGEAATAEGATCNG